MLSDAALLIKCTELGEICVIVSEESDVRALLKKDGQNCILLIPFYDQDTKSWKTETLSKTLSNSNIESFWFYYDTKSLWLLVGEGNIPGTANSF